MNYLLALFLLAIVASLATAGFFLLRKNTDDPQQAQRGSRHLARTLAVRVALSITLFLCLLAAWKLGYITPTGLPMTSR